MKDDLLSAYRQLAELIVPLEEAGTSEEHMEAFVDALDPLWWALSAEQRAALSDVRVPLRRALIPRAELVAWLEAHPEGTVNLAEALKAGNPWEAP